MNETKFNTTDANGETDATSVIGMFRSLLVPGALILLGLAIVVVSRASQPKLEFEGTSEFSTIRVRSSGDTRSLLFVRDDGREVVESRINVTKPHQLMLGYSQSMFASHLVHSEPKRVLIVGLGGGAMVHYLKHHFPETHIDALEIDPMVVEVADRFFDVHSSDRIRILTFDAFEFLAQDHQLKYDVVYMDAFLKPSEDTDATGVPQRLKTIAFYEQIQSNLNDDGLVVFNINTHQQIEEDIATIQQAFHATLLLSSPGATNRVAIGSTTEVPTCTEIRIRAEKLDSELVDSHSFTNLLNHCSDWNELGSGIPQ